MKFRFNELSGIIVDTAYHIYREPGPYLQCMK
jgi:hypothetical protein